MDTVLLFRKRTPLTDDRLPWLRGSEEHPWTARRNTSGKGVVSAILVRALLSARGKVLGVIEAVNKIGGSFDLHDQEVLGALCHSAAIALENARLLGETQHHAEQMALLYQAGLTLNRTLDIHEQLEALYHISMQALNADHGGFFHYDAVEGEVRYQFGVGQGADLESLKDFHARVGEEHGLIGLVAKNREPLYLPDVTGDPRWIETDPTIRSALWVPVEHEGQLLGLLSVVSKRVNAFTPNDQQLLTLLANQVAVSLENARLYETALNAAERRTTLHWLSQEIISSSLEPERIYTAIHQAVFQMMPCEAFLIGLLNETFEGIDFTYCIDRGKRYPIRHIAKSQSLSGRVIETGKSIILDDLEQDASQFELVHFGGQNSVRSILAVPMRQSGKVIGIVSTQSYQPHAFSEEDASLLETLAAYAAIALENSRLFSQMQASNIELANAYESTIEGWSRALEMRDKETKGHSERVTRITQRLARELGLAEEAMYHLRRGVLLHDIGKMAIPDHILLKPGPLTEDEWQVIRQHPNYGYQLLSGIPFLNLAIDIPYCHHENWDGSGYPRGLKMEEIPLGARIFALVDVWDALTSDRPYRPAWIPEMARSYIAAQSGIRFDPQVVEVFLRLLDTGELLKT